MKLLNLQQAADFLGVNPEVLRRKARAGVIPGAKPGKAWVFIDDDLVGFLRSLYPESRQASKSGKELAVCHSTDVEKSGMLSSRTMEKRYEDLLGLRTRS